MFEKIKCLFGFHDWKYVTETNNDKSKSYSFFQCQRKNCGEYRFLFSF